MSKLGVRLADIRNSVLDGRTKGFPGNCRSLSVSEIAEQRWNILREDVPFPVAVLQESALRHNSWQMRNYLGRSGANICPHGKTTMSPQLFERQIQDGAWGLTAATTAHVNVYRNAGIKRIFFANQLVGKANVRYIAGELNNDADFDFYCLVDSQQQLESLVEILGGLRLNRRLNVLIEVGVSGGRCGVRALSDGVELARCIKQHDEYCSLVGIEAFEGLFPVDRVSSFDKVDELLERVVELAEVCDREDLFAVSEILLTAGGSIFFDRAVGLLSGANLTGEPVILLRSGCYLTHDSGLYAAGTALAQDRCGAQYPRFKAALQIWTCVQSVPEPGLAILSMGKRDVSCDAGLPVPLFHAGNSTRSAVPVSDWEIFTLNDQHAFMRCPVGDEPVVGDLVGLGISHPCTTFDKWQLLYVVDDNYTVIEAVRTYF